MYRKYPRVASSKLQVTFCLLMKTTHLSPTRCIYSSMSQETPAHKFPCVTVPRLQETLASEETISQKYFVASSNSYTSSTHLVCIKVCESLQTLKWGVGPLLYVCPYLNSCVKIDRSKSSCPKSLHRERMGRLETGGTAV